MRFACVTDGHGPRVYSDYWSADESDVAAEYAERCDDDDAEGPTERVVFVRDLDVPGAAIVAVSITYEISPTYYGEACDDEPDDDLRAELDKVAADA